MSHTPDFLPSAFRRTLFRQPPAPAQEIRALFTKPGTGLYYEQFVTAFLRSFPAPMATVLGDLKAIWQTEGYVRPEDLPARLLPRYLPDAPPQAVTILQEQIKARFENPEKLTGYRHKQHAPLGIGMSHLFGVLTGQPVTLFLGDVSGMGAQNEHNAKLIARRDGLSLAQMDLSDAEALTDRLVGLATTTTLQTLARGARLNNKSVTWDPYRLGGDELAITAPGLPVEMGRHLNRTAVAPAMETLTAKTGSHKHEHTKHRDNRTRAGFGLAFAALPLDANTRPAHIDREADRMIERQKHLNGMVRRGRLDFRRTSYLSPSDCFALAAESGYLPEAPRHRLNDAARAAMENKLRENGTIDRTTPPLSDNDINNFLQLELANHLYQNARSQYDANRDLSQRLRTDYPRKPEGIDLDPGQRALQPYDHLSPEDAGDLLRSTQRVMQQEYEMLRPPRPQTTRTDIQDPSLPLFSTPLEREDRQLSLRLDEAGISLAPAQRQLLTNLLGSFSPLDPATGALMGDVMPAIFGRFREDAERLDGWRQSETAGATALRHQLGNDEQKLQAHTLGIAMANLAGINAVLESHENANIVLRHFANHIVIGAFEEMGIRRTNFELGHEGGGNMYAAIRPIIETPNGLVAMNDELLQAVQEEISLRTQQMGQMKVASFIREQGGEPPPGLSESLRFCDIPDPKRPNQPGIDVSTCRMVLRGTNEKGQSMSGGENYTLLRRKTEEEVKARRERRELASSVLKSRTSRRMLKKGNTLT